MSGRQDGESPATHVADQRHHAVAEAEAARSRLQATETQTDQMAQMARAVAVTMDKIAATSQEMAEHAAQLRNLSTWPRQAHDHAHDAIPAGYVAGYDGNPPQAAPSGATVLPLVPPSEPTQAGRQHRNPASRLIETLSPARLRAANGTHKTQERAPRLRDDRAPSGDCEIAAGIQTAAVIPLQLGRALPADHRGLAEVTSAAPYTHHEQELDLLDWIISNLFHVGLILLPAARQGGETAQGSAEALRCLDDTICRIRDHVSDAHANGR